MNLVGFNNKRVHLTTTDDEVFEGMALYQDADTYEEKEDSLSLKQPNGWVSIFLSEIKTIELI